ncbi:MAG TPA: SHOCT domain-containing protein [Thermoleophilaceae bacterium]|nr:SHOCT domain-containing protein [Thermoleophilaceae bacterium]
MPGLLRGVVRTAAVAGTATAVSGRVRRRQDERWAAQDAPPQEAPPQQPPPQGGGGPDPIAQLKELGELHAQGVLTDEEFAAQKAKLLG